MSKNNIINSGTFEKQRREEVVEKIRALPSREFRRFRKQIARSFANGHIEQVLGNLDCIYYGDTEVFFGSYAKDAWAACEGLFDE